MARRLSTLLVALPAILFSLLHISMAQLTHIVGDALAWTVPNGGVAAYSAWAAQKTFVVGNSLVFNFTTELYSVAEVTKAAFDSCNTLSPISISTNRPTNITLKSAGSHYYLCTFPSHCALGQKLAIDVSAASPTPQPAPATTVRTYIVGDNMGWSVPTGGPISYQRWANGESFKVGDTFVFNFVNGHTICFKTSFVIWLLVGVRHALQY